MSDFQTTSISKICRCVIVGHIDGIRYAQTNCLYCRGKGIKDLAREKTILRNQTRKIPTQEECINFTGAHCKLKFASLNANWRCPGCQRTKFELMRWTLLFPNKPHAHEGWAMGLHTHHDHRADKYRLSSVNAPTLLPRFHPELLCEQCNSVDAIVKRKLKLPLNFSFAPNEIAQFITATPNGWHLIDYDIAALIYAQVATVYNYLPSKPNPFVYK